MSTDPSALNSTSQRQPRSEVFDNHGAWPGVAKRVEDVSLIQPAQEVKKPSEDPAFGITMGSNICLLHGHNSRRDGASAHAAMRYVAPECCGAKPRRREPAGPVGDHMRRRGHSLRFDAPAHPNPPTIAERGRHSGGGRAKRIRSGRLAASQRSPVRARRSGHSARRTSTRSADVSAYCQG